MKVTYYGSFWAKQAAGGEVGQEGRRSDEVRCQGAAGGNSGANPGGPRGSLSPTRPAPGQEYVWSLRGPEFGIMNS